MRNWIRIPSAWICTAAHLISCCLSRRESQDFSEKVWAWSQKWFSKRILFGCAAQLWRWSESSHWLWPLKCPWSATWSSFEALTAWKLGSDYFRASYRSILWCNNSDVFTYSHWLFQKFEKDRNLRWIKILNLREWLLKDL